MKSSEVSIKTRSTPASLTIQGQVTKDTAVKWSILIACVLRDIGERASKHFVYVTGPDCTRWCKELFRRKRNSENIIFQM